MPKDNNDLEKDSLKKKKILKEKKSKSKSSRDQNTNKESWFKGYGKSVEAEFASRIASSKKRLIKFLGLSIIPIIYAVICIIAFWNPIENIGRANVTFIDQEQNVLLATSQDITELDSEYLVWSGNKSSLNEDAKTNSTKYFVSTLLEKNPDTSDDSNLYIENNNYKLEDKDLLKSKIQSWISKDTTNNEGDFAISANEKFGDADPSNFTINKKDIKNVYCVSGFKLLLMLNVLHESNPGTTDLESETFSTEPLSSQKIAFTNIHYQKWDNNGSKTWKSAKSNLQIKINRNFFRGIIDVFNFYLCNIGQIKIDNGNILKQLADIVTLVTNSNQLSRITSNQLDIWTTFARNFIFGYYANTINEFKGAILVSALDKLIEKVESSNVPEIKKIIAEIRSLGLDNLFDLKDIVNVDIQGVDNGIYGIGLGEFFLLIGLYVGSLLNTFVYDRAKRGGAKITKTQWYASKWTLLVATGFVQVTLLLLAVTAAGWYRLGAIRLLKLYGVLLLTDLVFKSTIQGIWFSFKDETIGKFVCVIYMVLNLSAGWGTFPSWMQFGFFNVVSHITAFKYSLQLIGLSAYGQDNPVDIGYAFQQVGFLLLIMAVFISIGLSNSVLRNREMHYGSYSKKIVIKALTELNETELAEKVKAEGFKALPKGVVMEELVQWVRINHPFEGQFKWFKKKNYDRPIKPNYTDDDIMTRNDDVLV